MDGSMGGREKGEEVRKGWAYLYHGLFLSHFCGARLCFDVCCVAWCGSSFCYSDIMNDFQSVMIVLIEEALCGRGTD